MIRIHQSIGVEDLGWWTREAQGPFGVGLWKDILKEAFWVKANITFSIGTTINAPVTDVWDPTKGNGCWKLQFGRAFNDWEVDLATNLLKTLQFVSLLRRGQNPLVKGGQAEGFTFVMGAESEPLSLFLS